MSGNNMIFHFVSVVAALTLAARFASGNPLYNLVSDGNDIYAIPSYKYSYSVNDVFTGDTKSFEESREGDITRGSYSLLQPDGLVRTVIYHVHPLTGFQAQVFYTPGPIIEPVVVPVIAPPPPPPPVPSYRGHYTPIRAPPSLFRHAPGPLSRADTPRGPPHSYSPPSSPPPPPPPPPPAPKVVSVAPLPLPPPVPEVTVPKIVSVLEAAPAPHPQPHPPTPAGDNTPPIGPGTRNVAVASASQLEPTKVSAEDADHDDTAPAASASEEVAVEVQQELEKEIMKNLNAAEQAAEESNRSGELKKEKEGED